MEFGVVRRDPKQAVLVSTHPNFRTALEQKDKLGFGHEVIVLHSPQSMEEEQEKPQGHAVRSPCHSPRPFDFDGELNLDPRRRRSLAIALGLGGYGVETDNSAPAIW